MLWNDVPMQWDGENMRWAAVEYTDDVPNMQRARYIWMRTRVGDGEWQYTRLTGSTSWDPENLGVCTTACPTQSKEGLGLVEGDYFVAGAQFTDPVDGNTYEAGYAYVYNGSAWEGMDITSADNARKASDLLDSLITSNTQIPASNNQCSIWLWAKNFAAQNAVIDNLFSQAITILSGGHIKGGNRYDDNGNLVDWSEKGFWFGADGTLRGALLSDADENTFLGTDVGMGSELDGAYAGANVGVGYQALNSVWRGNGNVAVGYQAAFGLIGGTIAGRRNVAIGYQAMYGLTGATTNTGQENIAIGYKAMYSSGGRFNVAIGSETEFQNTSGRYQMNFNNSIIHLEFAPSRTGAQIAAGLGLYRNSNVTPITMGAFGVFDGSPIIAVSWSSVNVTIYTVSGTTINATSTSSHTTATYSTRTIITFANPLIADSTRPDATGDVI